jgi:C4-dicarboxylate-specific signal transduction histidine kinase
MEKALEEHRLGLISGAKMSALGQMASGVAHEINNPLAVIQNLSAQMEELVTEKDVDRGLIVQMTKNIIETTTRIAKIVQGLRVFSREGSFDNFQSTNLIDVINDTLSFCQSRMNGMEIELKLVNCENAIWFAGRQVEVSQVLLNLLNNSCDAIAEFEEKWVAIGIREAKDWIEIHVSDSGKGIPRNIQAKIFQPFFTTKEAGKGTGLGLSISKGIISSHGGDLYYDGNSPNTCFVVKLPKSQAQSSAA